MNFLERFTSCLQINFPINITDEFFSNLHETIYGSDAVEIKFDLIQVIKLNISASNVKIDEFIAQVRRCTYSSIPIILSISNSLSELNLFIDEYSISSGNDFNQIKTDLRSFYFNILNSGIKTGLDYLAADLSMCFNNKDNFIASDSKFDDIILTLKELVMISGHTEIIGLFASTDPNFWVSKYGTIKVIELASNIGIKFLRLTSIADELSDNFKIIFFQQNLKLAYPNLKMEITAFNTGKLGRLSKVVNKILTPVSINSGLSIEPYFSERNEISSLSSYDIQRALHSSFITPSLDFYIMGINVSKSLSPKMHSAAYKTLGLPHVFKLFECSSLTPNLTNLVNSPTFGGTAIIMPFKMEALDYVDTISEHVKIIGALNTIVAERSIENPNRIIKTRGENTDWLGVKLTLLDNISPINAINKNKTALVIGAGGMSRAAIYALIELGYQKILLYNRSFEKAQKLADYYNSLSPIPSSVAIPIRETNSNDLNYFEIVLLNDEEHLKATIPNSFDHPSVIISCIPSSDPVTGKLTNFELSLEWFKNPSGGVVLETGYDPLVTPLLRNTSNFRNKGWVGINGLNYLYAQVLAQFEMFTNKPAPEALLKNVVINHYQKKKSEVDFK